VWTDLGAATSSTIEFVLPVEVANTVQIRFSRIYVGSDLIYIDEANLLFDYQVFQETSPVVGESSSIGVPIQNNASDKPVQVLVALPDSETSSTPSIESDIVVDMRASHRCEVGQYQLVVDSVDRRHAEVGVMLSGADSVSSTLRVSQISEGLSFTFSNGLHEIVPDPSVHSVILNIDSSDIVDTRSLNIPIIYSVEKHDGTTSNAVCQFNVIAE